MGVPTQVRKWGPRLNATRVPAGEGGQVPGGGEGGQVLKAKGAPCRQYLHSSIQATHTAHTRYM